MDYDEVYKMVTKEQSIVKVKKGVSKDVADKIRKSGPFRSGNRRGHQALIIPLGAFAITDAGNGNGRQHRTVRPGAAVQYLPERRGWKVDQLYGYQRKPPVLTVKKNIIRPKMVTVW